MIAGLGITDMGPVYGRSASRFAVEAVRLAAADAGLQLSDVDGLLTSSGTSGGVGLGLQRDLELHDLKLLSEMQGYGSTAGAMVQVASMAVQAGMAEVVACVFADAPLTPGRSAGDVYGGARSATGRPERRVPTGWGGLQASTGASGTNTLYTLAARRHMLRYGTTTEDFGAIAVAQRAWAAHNPRAQMRAPTHPGRPPGVAVDRGAVPPSGLLPGVQRWDRRRGDDGGSGPVARPAAGAGARVGPEPSGPPL